MRIIDARVALAAVDLLAVAVAEIGIACWNAADAALVVTDWGIAAAAVRGIRICVDALSAVAQRLIHRAASVAARAVAERRRDVAQRGAFATCERARLLGLAAGYLRITIEKSRGAPAQR